MLTIFRRLLPACTESAAMLSKHAQLKLACFVLQPMQNILPLHRMEASFPFSIMHTKWHKRL